MCQISVCNLNDPLLNRKLFLLMGSIGSVVHKDGWGIADATGASWKCGLPMYYTTDSGDVLRKFIKGRNNSPLLGHIRQASPRVPVVTKNAHPFVIDDIVFVHNGKLTPKVEKDFVLEEEVPDLDKDGKKQFNKDGSEKMRKVAISDSLIFFQKFMEFWKEQPDKAVTVDDHFVAVLNKTMNLFYGKFAFVFIIGGTFYIVRGKTADLYVSYMTNGSGKEAPVLGWAVNTSKEVLDDAGTLLSNLQQLEGKPALTFTYPALLKEESVFKVDGKSVKLIGEIKQNVEPVVVHSYGRGVTNGNFTPGTGNSTGAGTKVGPLGQMYKDIFQFMNSYSLNPHDIQVMFYVLYSASLLEVTEIMLKHFTKKVMPLLAQMTNKDIRRSLRKALSDMSVGHYRYSHSGLNLVYPWMLNNKSDQLKLVKAIEEERKSRS